MTELVIELELDLDAIREELGIRDSWTPTTEEDMDKVANYYLWCDDEERRLRDMHKLRIKRVNTRRTYLDYKYRPVLEGFARQNLSGTKRSFDLPTARLAFRKTGSRWTVADHDKLNEWVKLLTPEQREEFGVKTEIVYVFNKDVLFDRAQNGEVIPGLEYVPAGESFSVVAA